MLDFWAYQNYYYYYTWQQCRRCGQRYSEISFKGKWIEDKQTLNVTVNADYALIYDTQGGNEISSTTASVPETTHTLEVTSQVPTREGYFFKGWAETPNPAADDILYKSGDSIELEWTSDYGSTDNPVSKTLYAVWEKDDTTTETTYLYVVSVVASIISMARRRQL